MTDLYGIDWLITTDGNTGENEGWLESKPSNPFTRVSIVNSIIKRADLRKKRKPTTVMVGKVCSSG